MKKKRQEILRFPVLERIQEKNYMSVYEIVFKEPLNV